MVSLAALLVAVPKPLVAAGEAAIQRPDYHLDASIDYDLLTLQGKEWVSVPVHPGDSIDDVVFFAYANTNGVGGADGQQKNIVVDKVTLNGAPLPFTLQGPLLRAKLPERETQPFALQLAYRGVIPRSPAGSGGLMDMMGDIGGDLGGLLGGTTAQAPVTEKPAAPKVTDYGLYTYGHGMLSLGSFWYPQLAVRTRGKWADDLPDGPGDLASAETSDFSVTLHVPAGMKVAAPGWEVPSERHPPGPGQTYSYRADGVRDFAVLMSPDYVIQSQTVDVAGKTVVVQSFTLPADQAKSGQAVDIAAHALQDYAKRFGPYAYNEFRVVEGPIRGGAGGMEYSGLTAISSALYGDMSKQLSELTGELGAGSLDKVMTELDSDNGATANGATTNGAAGNKPGNPTAAPPGNEASSLLNGLLGQQKQIFDSMFEVTISHEVAHQWWAIGVGSDSQSSPFVDESLANYSSMIYFEDRYGLPTAQKMMDVNLKTAYSMGRMLGNPDAPANLKTSAYKNNIQYGGVVYGKGALYYDSLRRLVGDGPFFAALRQYYAQYRDRLAGPRTLLEIVEQGSPAKAQSVEALYHRWIESAHGDEDITGGPVGGIGDLLGGMLGE